MKRARQKPRPLKTRTEARASNIENAMKLRLHIYSLMLATLAGFLLGSAQAQSISKLDIASMEEAEATAGAGTATATISNLPQLYVCNSMRCTGKRRYELTDHLLNVRSVVSDRRIVQTAGASVTNYTVTTSSWTDFYAYGQPLNGRSPNNPAYRYGLNGQEKTDEVSGTANHSTAPFWEYSPRAALRWNMDPKPDAAWSPYSIVHGNPIAFSDPLGDTLKITHRTGFLGLGKKETLLYEDGKLMHSNRTDYEGKVKGYLKKVTTALGQIDDGDEGADMISELQGSKNVFTIERARKNEFKPSKHNNAYRHELERDEPATYAILTKDGKSIAGGSGGTIFWSPSKSTSHAFELGNDDPVSRPFIFLAHEMFHALDANRGRLYSKVVDGVKGSEWQAVYRENILRDQLKLPLRTHYKRTEQIMDKEPNINKPTGPYMLTPDHKPLLPSWYTH